MLLYSGSPIEGMLDQDGMAWRNVVAVDHILLEPK